MEIPSFYLNNTAGENQLEQLLQPSYIKIVFQFAITPAAELKLCAFSCKQNGKDFIGPQNLTVDPSRPPIPISSDQLLGNLELAGGNIISQLRTIVNHPDHPRLFFRALLEQGIIVFEFDTIALAAFRLNPCPPGDSI